VQDSPNISLTISVVCYYSAEEELRALLVSLLASLHTLKTYFNVTTTTIYLIDNSESHSVNLVSFDGLSAEMESLGVELRLLQGQGNVGYGSAHNLAIGKVSSDYHLILNPDVILESACLSEGVAYLENNQSAVVVSPYSEDQHGQKQYLCKRYPTVLTFFVRGFLPVPFRKLFKRRLARYEMHDLIETMPAASVPIVSGCFMLCRTDKLKAVGGFDEGYFLYFEDFDLSLRLGSLDKLAYLPEMKIKHSGGHSAKKGMAHVKMFIRSARRFFATHGWRFLRQS
jgi:GT2 family glycosyltransferase